MHLGMAPPPAAATIPGKMGNARGVRWQPSGPSSQGADGAGKWAKNRAFPGLVH